MRSTQPNSETEDIKDIKGGMRREIDRDKVRAEARKLDGTGLRVWLDRAIDMLPDEAFPELIADYVHLKDIFADERTRPDLLCTIRQFHRDSLAGRYYQDFMVNSQLALGDSAWTYAVGQAPHVRQCQPLPERLPEVPGRCDRSRWCGE